MKGYLAFSLFVVLSFSLAAVRSEEKVNERVAKAFNKCKEKHNPPQADLDSMKKTDLEYQYSKESKCMVACMMSEGMILRGGKYNKENALIMADVLHKDDAEEAAKARQVVENCAKEHPEVGPDECEFAYSLAICSGHEAHKVGMKRTPEFFNP